jgi:hypothetical protein
MAGDLNTLPRRQFGIGLFQQPFDPNLKTLNFLGDFDIAGIALMPKFLDLAFEFGDRFFKIQKTGNAAI